MVSNLWRRLEYQSCIRKAGSGVKTRVILKAPLARDMDAVFDLWHGSKSTTYYGVTVW